MSSSEREKMFSLAKEIDSFTFKHIINEQKHIKNQFKLKKQISNQTKNKIDLKGFFVNLFTRHNNGKSFT